MTTHGKTMNRLSAISSIGAVVDGSLLGIELLDMRQDTLGIARRLVEEYGAEFPSFLRGVD